MALIENPIILAVLAVFIAAHIAAELLPRAVSNILSYVNVFLHALMVIPLGILKFTIEEAVLFYMISIFALTAARCVSFLIKGRASKNADKSPSPEQASDEPERETEERIIDVEEGTV